MAGGLVTSGSVTGGSVGVVSLGVVGFVTSVGVEGSVGFLLGSVGSVGSSDDCGWEGLVGPDSSGTVGPVAPTELFSAGSVPTGSDGVVELTSEFCRSSLGPGPSTPTLGSV